MNNFIYVWLFISSICLSLVLALICHDRLWSLQDSTATRREPTTRPRPRRRPPWSASHPRIWRAWSALPFPTPNEARLREMQRQHDWYLMMMVHPFRDSRILKQHFLLNIWSIITHLDYISIGSCGQLSSCFPIGIDQCIGLCSFSPKPWGLKGNKSTVG